MPSTLQRLTSSLAAFALVFAGGCSGTHKGPDAAARDAGPGADAAAIADAGSLADSGSVADGGASDLDAGDLDAGEVGVCAPRHVGSVESAGCFCSGPLIRHGRALYRQAIGIDVYDLANPDEPRFVRTLEERGGSEGGLAVVRGHLISVTNFAPLLVHDLSDPLHPVRVAELDLGGSAWGIAVDGDIAAVPISDGDDGSVVVRLDVSDPSSPRELGRTPLGERVNGPVVADDGRAWFVEVHFEQPGAPLTYSLREVALASGETTRHSVPEGGSLAASDGRVYLASPSSGLRIYERRGAALVELGRYALDGRFPTAVEAAGGRVLVVSETLSVLDVRDPSRPLRRGESEPSFGGEWLRGSDTHAYLSNGSSLHVFALECDSGVDG